jgi:hypothetical protein
MGRCAFTKVRYRDIKKNHEWLLTAFALVNLYQHRKRLIPQLASSGASVSGGRKMASRDTKRGRTSHIYP